MRYIKPFKLKVMTIAFLATGGVGVFVGLSTNVFYITTLAVINICLGGFVGWVFLNQEPRHRKKKS